MWARPSGRAILRLRQQIQTNLDYRGNPAESQMTPLLRGTVAHAEAPGRVRRNMPDPVPAVLLGRLAVDRAYQGLGLGTGLLRDAILRTVQAAEIAGIRVILVHAISDAAKHFYEKHGFIASPVDPMTVRITIREAIKILSTKD